MKHFLLCLVYLLCATSISFAQDSVPANATAPDSVSPKNSQPDTLRTSTSDTLRQVVAPKPLNQDSIAAIQTMQEIRLINEIIRSNRYYRISRPPVKMNIELSEKRRDEGFFYLFAALFFYFAMIKLLFPKYFDNLVSIFFRVTMRQQQIREQLLQTPLPSLLLNILFVISAGLYLAFLSLYYKVSEREDFFVVFAYCLAFVGLLYVGKFIFLKTMGWIFNIGNATDTYVFVVFLINKMIGIFLLPFLVLLAFPHNILYPVAVTLSYVFLVLMLLYRFFISYRPIRNEIKVNKFHFFLYLCAFEIAPLLLIYKVLLNFVERSI